MIPQHVAIIMDGNRRFASQRGLLVQKGHSEGAEALTRVVRSAKEYGIKYLTVFAFSTENWQRPRLEVEALMRLFDHFLQSKLPMMLEEGVRFHAIGDRLGLSKRLQARIASVEEETSSGDSIDLIMGINYGARDEICRAIKRIENIEDLTEENFSTYLDTARWPDPDLLIRTGGEKRVSNFLLWQISYSEIFTTDVLWPEFSKEDLHQAIQAFQQRTRRKGR